MLMALITTASGLLSFAGSQTVAQHFQVPAWNIRVLRDKFTGDHQCMIFQGKRRTPMVSYAHGVVSFQFSKQLNTVKASFKIDGGAVEPWDAVYPALAQTGAQLEGRSLDNPTGGKVMMPLSVLHGAHVVIIRPTPTKHPVRFSIDGLGDVLASAHNLGCTL